MRKLLYMVLVLTLPLIYASSTSYYISDGAALLLCSYNRTPFLCENLRMLLNSYFTIVSVLSPVTKIEISNEYKYDMCVVVADGSDVWGISFDKKHIITDLSPLKEYCRSIFMITCRSSKYSILFNSTGFVGADGDIYNVPAALLLAWYLDYLSRGYNSKYALELAKKRVLQMTDFITEVYNQPASTVYATIESYEYYGPTFKMFIYNNDAYLLIPLSDSLKDYLLQKYGTYVVYVPKRAPIWVFPTFEIKKMYSLGSYIYVIVPLNLLQYSKYTVKKQDLSDYYSYVRHLEEVTERKKEELMRNVTEEMKVRRMVILAFIGGAVLTYLFSLLTRKSSK